MAYVATIGFFDGVHRGHRYLIGQLLREAAERGMESAILTFEQHPKHMPLLTTFDERTALLRETGVTEIFCFQFPVIQPMTASEFMQVLYRRCGVRVLLMGYDHRFGSDQPARYEDYVSMGREVGIEIVPIAQSPEGAMSSSKIRQALMLGQVEQANEMLGYAYTLSGTVVHGREIGHQLGFPTANIAVPADKLLPLPGVYAAEGAVVNIGTNPTVGGQGLTIEAHFIGRNEDLYDETVSIRLLRRLRDEQKFHSLDELRHQIAQDIASVTTTSGKVF